MVCADLLAGSGSYIDFVLDVSNPGPYAIGASLLTGGTCNVSVADVVDDAAQADADYLMKYIGAVEAGRQRQRRVQGGFLQTHYV